MYKCFNTLGITKIVYLFKKICTYMKNWLLKNSVRLLGVNVEIRVKQSKKNLLEDYF